MTSSKKNLKELIIVNSFLTVLVVMIHTIIEPLNYYDKGTANSLIFFIIRKIISFAVPGFIFLSSFKIFYSIKTKNKFNFKPFILKRINKTYIPYIIMAIIQYIFLLKNNFIVFNAKEFIVSLFIKGDISIQFYFIIVIFQLYCLVPIFVFILKKFKPMTIILVSFLINAFFLYFLSIHFEGSDNFFLKFYFFNYDRIFLSYIFYWMLGACFGNNYDQIKKKMLHNKIIICTFYFAISVFHITLSYFDYVGSFSYKHYELFQIIFSSISIVFLYLISLKISSLRNYLIDKGSKLLSNVSFYVYLVHMLVLYFVEQGLDDLGLKKIYVRFLIRFTSDLFFSIIISIIMVIIVKYIGNLIKDIKESKYSQIT